MGTIGMTFLFIRLAIGIKKNENLESEINNQK